jgi:hypothetical protein
MPIRFRCPSGHKLAAPEERAGRKARCPKCNEVVTIPGVLVVAHESAEDGPAENGPTKSEAKHPSVHPAGKPESRSEATSNPNQPSKSVPAPQTKPVTADQSSGGKRPKEGAKQTSPKPPPPPEIASKPRQQRGRDEKQQRPPDKKTPKTVAKRGAQPPPLKPRSQPPPPQPPRPELTKAPPAIPTIAGRPPADQPKSKTASEQAERKEKSAKTAQPQAAATVAYAAATVADAAADQADLGSDVSTKTGWLSTEPGYRPDRSRVQTVRLLAMALALLTGMCLWPALANIGSFGDRLWVSAVVFLSALQLAYIIWMLSVPDWSTLRVMMGVFTCVAAVYGMGMAATFFSEPGDPTVLQFEPPHERAPLWCGLIVILSGLMVYLLGRCDTAWRKAYWLNRS